MHAKQYFNKQKDSPHKIHENLIQKVYLFSFYLKMINESEMILHVKRKTTKSA